MKRTIHGWTLTLLAASRIFELGGLGAAEDHRRAPAGTHPRRRGTRRRVAAGRLVTGRDRRPAGAHLARGHPAGAAADARRRDQAGARSQPRHRRAAAEPADVRLLDREPAGDLQADADLARSAAVGDDPVDTDDLGRVGRHRHRSATSTPSTAASRRTSAGAAARSPRRSTTTGRRRPASTALFNPQYNTNWSAQYTQPLLRNFKIDNNRQQLVVTKLNQDISEIQLQALDHQHASRTCGTRTGITCSRRSRWRSRSASVELADQLVKDNQTRVEIGTMAPIDVVQAQSQAATQRQNLATAEGTRRTTELALKRLIVGGTEDPNWNADDRPDRSARLRPRADRRPGRGPARAREPHRPAAGAQEPGR